MSAQSTSDTGGTAHADSGFPVRFELLGEFNVVCRGRRVRVGGPTAQAVLIALLHHRNERVSRQQIADDAWGRSTSVRPDSVYHYIAGLRRVLSPTGVAIIGRPDYRIDVPDHAVDAVQFDTLVTSARALRNTDPEQAVHRFGRALDLWHGPAALPGITLPGIRLLANALDARRLDAEEDLAELELDRGRADQVLDRLRDLAGHHLERPGLLAALIRALHATGRTEEAERHCTQAERAAQAKRRPVHPKLAIAAADLRARHRAPPPARPSTVPFQLPPDTSHFTGRADELACLLGLSPPVEESAPGAPVVAVVEGMAGVGKTALAVHAGHRLADRFDHGVLFCDLRGFTPDADPAPPEATLDTLLRGLGVPGGQIPPDSDGRVALYRSVLAHRRVLVVLDNAASETQVRPLLPSTPGCLVLVTSRRHLAGLDTAAHIGLGALPASDAVALFRAILADRVTGNDTQPMEHIVALCECLPLAVRIAAARLRTTRAMAPAHLAAELDEELRSRKRLDALSDGERSVAAALAVSYHHLTADQRTAFRLLGLHPGPHLGPYTLAALADTTAEHARRLLDDLCAVSLAEQPAYQRYALHGLVGTYAAELVAAEGDSDRRAALGRLFDHYAHAATLAMDAVYPHGLHQRPRPRPPTTPTPELDDPAVAAGWLDTELDNLLAAAHLAGNGWTDHTVHQSQTLHRHLHTGGYYGDALRLHARALGIARSVGDRVGELTALTGLGQAHRSQGRHERAADCFTRALDLAERASHHPGEVDALNGLGDVHLLRGRPQRATDCFQQALGIARRIDNPLGELDALDGLGDVHLALGYHRQAAGYYRQVLVVARRINHRPGELDALDGLGDVHMAQGHHRQAARYYLRALGIARRVGSRHFQFEAHQGCGRVNHALDRQGRALACHTAALELATELGHPDDQARAHDGLACALLALGNGESARQHWQTALDLLTAHRITHTWDPQVTAEAIQARLAALDG